jgi:hypothetical protein
MTRISPTYLTGSVDFNEFCIWIDGDEEIQAFLIEYMCYQTREHALKQYKAYYEKYIDCYNVVVSQAHSAIEEAKEIVVCPLSHPRLLERR